VVKEIEFVNENIKAIIDGNISWFGKFQKF
jgi:hypothetical protein